MTIVVGFFVFVWFLDIFPRVSCFSFCVVCLVKDRYGDRANDSGSESSESSSDDSEVVSVQRAACSSFLTCSLCQRGEAVYNDPCRSLPGAGPFFGAGLLSNVVSAEEEGP